MEKSSTAVWFYIGIENEIRERFLEELVGLGYTFLNDVEVSEEAMGYIVSVHTDKKIANVSLMVWINSFKIESNKNEYYSKFYDIPKIDYEKNINGDDDYIIASCNHKRVIS